MINKQFILGTVLGIFIGVSSSSFAYYSSYDNLTELTAGDLEDIVESAIAEVDSKLDRLALSTSDSATVSDLLIHCSG